MKIKYKWSYLHVYLLNLSAPVLSVIGWQRTYSFSFFPLSYLYSRRRMLFWPCRGLYTPPPTPYSPPNSSQPSPYNELHPSVHSKHSSTSDFPAFIWFYIRRFSPRIGGDILEDFSPTDFVDFSRILAELEATTEYTLNKLNI